jgi:hypothetical protein
MGTFTDYLEVAIKLCDISRVILFANKENNLAKYISSMKKNLSYKTDRYIGYLEILRKRIIIRLGKKYGISTFFNHRSAEKFHQPEEFLLLKILKLLGKDDAIYDKRPALQGVSAQCECSNFIFV